VADRFSASVADQIPPEYHEKFRFFNHLVWGIIASLLITLVASAWWGFVGWQAPDLLEIISSAGIAAIKWVIALFLLLFATKLPRLGTWLFYWWIRNPINRQRMEADIKKYQVDRYESSDPWYNKKIHFFTAIKRTQLKPLWIFIIAGNNGMVLFFFIIRSQYNFAGSIFSAVVGILFVIVQIANLLAIWAGSAFYCKKTMSNRKQRQIVELLSWGYMLFLPITFVMFIIGNLITYELMKGVPQSAAPPYFLFYQILYVITASIMIGLGLFLMKKTPNFEWRKNEEDAPAIQNATLESVMKILRILFVLVFIGAYIGILFISMELIMADFAMAICVVSYYLVVIYSFILFALLKLIPKRPLIPLFRNRLNYTTLIKVSAVILVINFLPLVGTTTITNPSLENQFTEVFGPTWREEIRDHPTYPYMHQVSFSWFDAYFGYNMPVNAKYEQVYMQSHPRYVRDRSTRDILSNGSAPYENITHNLIFDAYLPARPEFKGITFGDGRPEKFPVVIYLHGIGMDRGSGNANWTTQYFANLGYAAFDMSYGFTGWADYPYTGGKERGYDFVDTILQIAQFTKYLEANADYYHVDLSNTYIAGRSFGGWMALCVGYLANTTYAGGNYSSQVKIRGVFPYYPASDIPGFGSDLFQLAIEAEMVDTPYIRGSSNPTALDFNPDWLYYDPLWMAENIAPGGLPVTFGIQGTHDYLVPAGATRRLESALKENGHKVIAGFYPFGSHGFDAIHWSPYGQSILYYMERMMALNSVC
jgi:acetyl esterase/lipase